MPMCPKLQMDMLPANIFLLCHFHFLLCAVSIVDTNSMKHKPTNRIAPFEEDDIVQIALALNTWPEAKQLLPLGLPDAMYNKYYLEIKPELIHRLANCRPELIQILTSQSRELIYGLLFVASTIKIENT